MKISQITSRESGGTLLATLFFAALFATILGAYMSMTTQENLTVKRSTGWNAALPLAEAGIEEACSQVNKNTNGYWADGWTFNTNTWAFNKTRFLADSYYSVDINGWPGGVIAITSTGNGCWTGSNYITRIVQLTAQTPVPFVPSGLIANNITFGGTFRADSYDSALGPYTARRATDHVVIGNPTGGFSLAGNSYVKGFVVTPGSALVTCQGSSTVGDASYHVNASIQTIPVNHWTNFTSTPNFPPVTAPYAGTNKWVKIPTNGIVAGTHYDYVLNTGGFYYSSNLTASLYGKSMYVSSNATLVLAGNVDLASITFNPNTNAAPKLSVFIAMPDLSFTPAIINAGPPQFWVYGLPSCTSMKITSSDFVGVIYAPDMDLTASGNSSVSGAIVAKSFTCTGTFDFHFDDATGGNAAKAFKILSWAEL